MMSYIEREKAIFSAKGIKPKEKVVLWSINSHLGANERSFPSQATIAMETAMSRKTVNEAIRRLRETGILQTEVRHNSAGHRSSLLYLIDWDALVDIEYDALSNKEKSSPKPQGKPSKSPRGYKGQVTTGSPRTVTTGLLSLSNRRGYMNRKDVTVQGTEECLTDQMSNISSEQGSAEEERDIRVLGKKSALRKEASLPNRSTAKIHECTNLDYEALGSARPIRAIMDEVLNGHRRHQSLEGRDAS